MVFDFPQILFISSVLFRSVLFTFTAFFGEFLVTFLLISSLFRFWLAHAFSVTSSLSSLSRFVFRPRMYAVLDVGFPWILENVYCWIWILLYILLLCGVFYKCQLDTVSWWCCSARLYCVIFYFACFVNWREGLGISKYIWIGLLFLSVLTVLLHIFCSSDVW